MKKGEYKPKKNIYGRRAYIGNEDSEEFFLMPVKWDCEWYWGGVYLEGLRPETEETLRERQRNSDPEDYGIKLDGYAGNYFDIERWRDDLEEEWEEHNDTQSSQVRDETEYYLGFGTHTHCDSVLLNECKGDYELTKKRFDKLFLNEKQFIKLISLLRRFYRASRIAQRHHQTDIKKYLKENARCESILLEYEKFIEQLPNETPRGYWVNPETD